MILINNFINSSEMSFLENEIENLGSHGKYVELLPKLERYLKLCNCKYGEFSGEVGTVLNDLGGLTRNLGYYELSEKHFISALYIIRKNVSSRSKEYATALVNLSHVYRLTRSYEKCKRLLEYSINIYENTSDVDESLYSNAYNSLGVLFQELGDIDEAIRFFQIASDVVKLSEDKVLYAVTLNNLVNPFIQKNDFKSALQYSNECIDIFKEHLSAEHPLYLTAVNNLGTIYFNTKEYKKSLDCFIEIKELLFNTLGEDSPNYKGILENIKMAQAEIDAL